MTSYELNKKIINNIVNCMGFVLFGLMILTTTIYFLSGPNTDIKTTDLIFIFSMVGIIDITTIVLLIITFKKSYKMCLDLGKELTLEVLEENGKN